MIPPSTIMVIYGIFTETNIGKLFAAGVLPGHPRRIPALLRGPVRHLARPEGRARRGERSVRWRPSAGARARRTSGRVAASCSCFVMGGIYGGLFTATEGAGMGAFGAMVFALWRRALTWRTAVRGAGGERAHLGDAVHDPDRRADLRRLHQHHQHAGGPEGLRHALRAQPDHGGGRDLRDLRAARHGDGGALDGAPHPAGVLPGDRAPGPTTRYGSAS